MKKRLLTFLSLMATFSVSFAFADTTPASQQMTTMKHHGPCKTVAEACKAAGFIRGKDAPAGKGLFHDCMKPLLHGQSVAGVTVDSVDIQACKARIAERKKN